MIPTIIVSVDKSFCVDVETKSKAASLRITDGDILHGAFSVVGLSAENLEQIAEKALQAAQSLRESIDE